jgi:hypothetical protein
MHAATSSPYSVPSDSDTETFAQSSLDAPLDLAQAHYWFVNLSRPTIQPTNRDPKISRNQTLHNFGLVSREDAFAAQSTNS